MAKVVKIVLQGVDNATSALRAPIRSLDDLAKAADKLKGPMIAAASAATAAFAAMVKGQINAADETSKLAQKLGTTTEYLSTLEHAASLSGTSLEGLQKGFKTLATTALNAAGGSQEAQETFRALNLEFKNADGTLRGSEKMLADIADRFAAMRDGPEKAALAVKLFGRSGMELIPLLNAGSRGIAAMQDEARALGLELDGGAGRQAEDFNDTLERLQKMFTGMVRQVAQQVLPVLLSLAQQVFEAGKQSGVFLAVGQSIVDLFVAMVRVGGAVKDSFDLVGRGLGTLAAGWVEFFSGNVEEAREIWGEFAEGMKSDFNDLLSNFTRPSPITSIALPTVTGGGPVGEFNPVIGDTAKAGAEAARMVDAIYAEFERLNASKLTLLFLEERDRKLAAINSIADAEQRANALLQIEAITAQKQVEIIREMYDAQSAIVAKNEEAARELKQKQIEEEHNALLMVQELRNQFRLDHLIGVEREVEAEKQRLAAQLEGINALTIAEEEARLLREEAEAAHYERLAQLRTRAEQQTVAQAMAVQQARLQAMGQLFGSMATLAATFGKKNSAAYKAFAAAQALISAYLAATNIMAQPHLMYPLNLIAAAVTLAQGLGNVAAIAAAPTGVAHGGMDYVPRESTYLLDRGERVVSPRQNQDLTDFLNRDGGGGTGGPTWVEILLDGEVLSRAMGRMSRDGRLTIHAGAVV